jgi:hypothetical protein
VAVTDDAERGFGGTENILREHGLTTYLARSFSARFRDRSVMRRRRRRVGGARGVAWLNTVQSGAFAGTKGETGSLAGKVSSSA